MRLRLNKKISKEEEKGFYPMPEFFQLAVTLPGIILKLQTEKT